MHWLLDVIGCNMAYKVSHFRIIETLSRLEMRIHFLYLRNSWFGVCVYLELNTAAQKPFRLYFDAAKTNIHTMNL